MTILNDISSKDGKNKNNSQKQALPKKVTNKDIVAAFKINQNLRNENMKLR